MTRTRIALAVSAVALAVLAATGTAHAQYGVTTTTVAGRDTIPEVTVVRGHTVDLTGARCRPFTTVTVTFDDGRLLARLRADARGAFVVTFTVPADASLGRHLVTSRCLAERAGRRRAAKVELGTDGTATVDADGHLRQHLWVHVIAAGGSTTGALARTGGSEPAPLVGIGAGALVLGCAFLYGARRPRSA